MGELSDDDLRRKARLLIAVLRVMGVMVVVAFCVSLLEPRNDLRQTLAVYIPTALVLLGIRAMARGGRVVLSGWALSIFLWTLIVGVTLFYDGLKGGFAPLFIVSVMLAGSLIGGRSAAGLAVATSIWAAVLWFLEWTGRAPVPLAAYSPVNAWISLTISLVLAAVLLRGSLESLRVLHAAALASAAERDAALRRSIQAQKMELVGNVASGIAHDFNNLLAVIGAATQSLRHHTPGDASREVVETLEDLESATERASMMTRHLLTFGKAKAAEVGPTDLEGCVRGFAPMLPRLLGAKITAEVDVAPALTVYGSRAGLEQILLNLVVNARDAMPDGGKVKIRAAVDPETRQCVLAVEDTGIGMDAATQARIFDPFFTTKPTGTGLGLATLRDLVTRFEGTIAVRSAVGKGTTFEVRLRTADLPRP